VDHVVADETWYKTTYTNDDDSGNERNAMGRIDRSKGLTAKDDCDGREAEPR